MTPDPTSAVYFINPSHQSLCLFAYPLFVARQRLGKHVTIATNTHARKRIIGDAVSYTVRVVLKECGRLILPRTCFFNLRVYLASSKFCANII
jgi:hypothetical protein